MKQIVRLRVGRPSRLPAGGERPGDERDMADLLKQAGQVVALFALMITFIVGLAGLAIDVTFAWREELRIQRAADAAALAGVVYLPGNVTGGQTAASAEAKKNGYVASSTTTVSPAQAAANPREMDVQITTKVPTFFSRIFGINTFNVSRTGKAVYILPVPMGSPENYYGSFGPYKMRNAANTADATATLAGPQGQAMTARGFWGSVLTQGADVVNGDAYLPKKNSNQTGTNPQHNTTNYYDYAVVMPPGSSGGQVYIFDPAFCQTDVSNGYGVGDSWFTGTNPVSTYFNLYDTNNQPYNLAAQTLLGGSGSLFTNMKGADTLAHSAPGSGVSECRQVNSSGSPITYSDYRQYHNKWWELTSVTGALQGGHTYRVRVTTDPGNTSQDSTNARNQFSIFAKATGGAPQVYGIGAMQMYTPLVGSGNSTFYLAQIDAASGAGKTMRISLFDPGDTNGLDAYVKILQPTSSGWSAVNMTWTSTAVSSTHGSGGSGSGTSIHTNDSSNHSWYNGCWLTIDVPIPATYSAPQNGWWKIEYDMTGSGASTDETTWQVDIRGNPVHLIP